MQAGRRPVGRAGRARETWEVRLHDHGLALVQVGDGQIPENFATVAEVGDITGPNSKRTKINVTDQESLNTTREYMLGLRDPGEISFGCNFINDETQDSEDGLHAKHLSGETFNARLVIPFEVPETWEFPVGVSEFGFSGQLDNPIKADFVLALMGAGQIL